MSDVSFLVVVEWDKFIFNQWTQRLVYNLITDLKDGFYAQKEYNTRKQEMNVLRINLNLIHSQNYYYPNFMT